jgi:type II secretion system protein N
MRRGLAIAALVVLVFGAVGALTFPTDAVVRAVLERVPLPDGMQLAFSAAHLRPNGLRLDDVHVLRRSGRAAIDAEWLRLWPSLWGFWRDGTGRPWAIAAGACQGTIDVTVGVEPRRTPVEVELEHVELATCLPYVLPQADAYGRLDGKLMVRVGTSDPPMSDGTLELRGAAWTPGGPLQDLRFRADAGTVTWQLVERRLELTKIEATSSDFDTTGNGLVRLATPVDESVIDLRLTITPGATMPPLLRRYLDAVPGSRPNAQGGRTLRIQGTLRDPRAIAVDAAPTTLPTPLR